MKYKKQKLGTDRSQIARLNTEIIGRKEVAINSEIFGDFIGYYHLTYGSYESKTALNEFKNFII